MRWVVGILLVVAATLKLIEIYQHPSIALIGVTGRAYLPFLVGLEFSIGVLAITNFYWRHIRPLVVLLFAVFASYSLLLVTQGATSCGCFGQLEIHPWSTFLLDAAVFLGLIFEHLTKSNCDEVILKQGSMMPIIVVIGTILISLGISTSLSLPERPLQSNQQGFNIVSGMAILEPQKWIGLELPLLEFIDLDVSQGSWILLLHRHDCDKCQEAVLHFIELANSSHYWQIGIIEVPPYSQDSKTASGACIFGRLSHELNWFVQTPVEIRLRAGRVVEVSTDLSLTSLRNIAHVSEQ